MQVSQAPSLTHVGTAALGCPDGRSPVVLDHCILSLIALASLLTLSTPLFARTDCLSIQEAS
ncbi:MAG: hypothetical protein WA604_07730, partial [Candidatus Sulfotelmatobacter sp.]